MLLGPSATWSFHILGQQLQRWMPACIPRFAARLQLVAAEVRTRWCLW